MHPISVALWEVLRSLAEQEEMRRGQTTLGRLGGCKYSFLSGVCLPQIWRECLACKCPVHFSYSSNPEERRFLVPNSDFRITENHRKIAVSVAEVQVALLALFGL